MLIWRRFSSALILLSLTIAASAAVPKSVPRNTVGKVGTGIYRGQRVSYVIVNGRMMFDGDIVLEHVDQILPGKVMPFGATVDYGQFLWPLVGNVHQIPYMIDPASGDISNINSAISTYNSLLAGVIQWVPVTNQTDFVDFDLTQSGGGEGFSSIGRAGGKQIIGGAIDCTVATLLHEMGHATGFWHEQMRPDRDNYVTINFANMVTTAYSNSQKQFDDMQPLTLYDWGSIMEYFPLNFSKNGNPVIESIPAGMPLANTVGYSASDIDAIKRLYGAAPTEVTIATNPAGLQVIVDGVSVTTPQTFNWPLFSTHTLDIPSGVQTQSGVIQNSTTSTTFYYTYGRWNDNGAESHTITVLPGNNELAFPATKPAVTVYTASFIQLVPYSAAAFPSGAGTITPSPAPQSYPSVSGVFYIARQPVTLTASPSAGQNFYQFNNSPFWVDGGLSVNPKTFLVPDTGNPINMTTLFTPTSSPIYTIDSNPDGSNFFVIVDNGFWPAPTSFSPFYNSAWSVGSNHTITVSNPETPWTLNTRYAFVSWSDAGALSHTITAPSTSTNYTATLQPQFFLSDFANEPCAGSIAVSPSSPTGDSYYPTGTPLTFTATQNAGWTFTEWQQNLSGTANPLNVTMTDEVTGIADFNTVATPLTVTSLSPPAAVAGSSPFTLTINGTGFTSASVVFVNNLFHASKVVNPNTLTVAITSTDLKTPGGIQVFVENFPSGASCAAFAALPFNVASSPIVKPTPLSLGFGQQLAGTTSASKSVTLKNTSSSTVNINSISATGDFTIAGPSACGSTLAVGASCTVSLTFSPAVSGPVTGSLSISDSAPDSPQVVTLTGTGTLPLSITPATLAFGTVTVGTTSAAKTFTLTNNQSSTLNFSFAPSGNYAISATGTTCGVSLASKAACNIAVTFTPTANAVVNGAVTITDGTSFTPQLVALSGTGSGGAAAPLTFTPANLAFAVQVVGTTSAGKTVTVKNTSASSLTLGAIASSGAFSAVGNGTNPCSVNLVLNAGTSCTLSVTFSPAFGANGGIQGAIVVSDNATVGQQVLDVKGTAALPLTFAPPSLTFGAQTVGTASAAQTITMTNNLATSVSPAITGSGEYVAAPGGTTPCTSTLVAHAKCTFSVTFTPSVIGARPSTITVKDAANPGVQTLTVNGTGQ
jgi:Astacin (Peptidase family M12A)/Divergent InlB B-repeat domain/Abnormal spindle-like microcephaly-assoc'd, ASPM-SPD-2-Hydin